MSQSLQAEVTPNPDRIRLNMLSNDGHNIKIKIKLSWTVLQVKEHLYHHNYFNHEPFNQIISLHGTDLQNTQTISHIYDALTNKGSKGVLRALRGQLTWEDNTINVKDLTTEDQSPQSITEISLYIRAKTKTKKKLSTLHSNEPALQEFIAQNKRDSLSSVKSAHSEQSMSVHSSSSGHGYGVRFSPDIIRKKQERKALHKLDKSESRQSVIIHGSDNDSTDSSSSRSKRSKRSPEAAMDMNEELLKSAQSRRSLYADISERQKSESESDHESDENKSLLTQENVHLHTRKQSTSSIGSWSGQSMDWGHGPFFVKRMSVSSVGSAMPSDLEFYHSTQGSQHLWELDLPHYYDNTVVADSLERIHHKLDLKSVKGKSGIDILGDLDENKEMEIEKSETLSDIAQSEMEQKREDSQEKVQAGIESDLLSVKPKLSAELTPNVEKWKVKQVGVDSTYVDINKHGMLSRNESKENIGISDNKPQKIENVSENESESDNKSIDSMDENVSDINMNTDDKSDISSHSTHSSNAIYDREQIEEDKLRAELSWKTSYFGIFLIGFVWMSAFHCLYSFSAIVSDIVLTFENVKLFEFGLMYSFNFIGVGIGLFMSSYLLNKPKYMNSSQLFAKWSIFVIFITQLIGTVIFLYQYVITDQTLDAWLWFILVISRFVMGIAIGFNESSVNNLVFEWFSDDAFNRKLSSNATENEKEYLTKLSSRVLSYCLFLKEFGHISARIFLVPLLYLTFSDSKTLFVPLLFGVILSGVSWCGMVYTSYRDRTKFLKYQKVTDSESNYSGNVQQSRDNINIPRKSKQSVRNSNDEQTSDNDSESTPLLHGMDSRHKQSAQMIPDDWSYKDWYAMGLIGLNKSVVLSIVFLSLNFGISFSFTILAITNIVQQYQYTDYTANLLICLIPLCALFGSNWLRRRVLSKVNSVWTVMFVGCVLYTIVFALFAFTGLEGIESMWLPFICIVIFILGSECLFASGYELLLSSSPEYIHGLISGVNSSVNFIISGLCILIFSFLVMDYTGTELDVINQYKWAYAFCCFASIMNLMIAVWLKATFGSHVQEL